MVGPGEDHLKQDRRGQQRANQVHLSVNPWNWGVALDSQAFEVPSVPSGASRQNETDHPLLSETRLNAAHPPESFGP